MVTEKTLRCQYITSFTINTESGIRACGNIRSFRFHKKCLACLDNTVPPKLKVKVYLTKVFRLQVNLPKFVILSQAFGMTFGSNSTFLKFCLQEIENSKCLSF